VSTVAARNIVARQMVDARGRESIATAVGSYIEREVIAGRLVPGDPLDEAELARKFDVSRTPVREALLQLAAIDLVRFRPRRGAIVATVTLQRMLQMFEVMAELEASCARFAAERMSSAERKSLKAAAQACAREAASDAGTAFSRYFDANYAFHERVYVGAHNEYLLRQAIALRNRLSPYRRFLLRSAVRIRTSSRGHDAVTKGIVEGDAEEAARQMRAHVTIAGAALSEMASQLPPSYIELER
jgi:DNA-binding GntR family transcriptional regulator